jgi:hypothetical protein
MGTRDPRIDAYTEKSAEFAKPVLRYLRELVHQGCPEVEETLKWSMPSFTYKGLLCGMAAFKHHVSFGFWKHGLVVGKAAENEAMGEFARIAWLEAKREETRQRRLEKALAWITEGKPQNWKYMDC